MRGFENNGIEKPFLQALKGIPTKRVPFWFMRQAGRYLPEYRALRAEKGGFLAMAYDPQAACEITLQPIRRFGMDAAIIFSDILVVPHALGQHLEFQQGEGPVLDPVRTGTQLDALGFDAFDQVLEPVFEAIRQTRAGLVREGFSQTALIGFAGAPWTVATYMIEGGGSKDYPNAKAMMYGNPVLFGRLIDLLVEATSAYLMRQADAGAEALQIFDSWAGVLDEESFARWVIEPTRRIVDKVRAHDNDIPIIGFPRGAGHFYLRYAQETSVSALGLDTSVPTGWAADTLQPLLPVQGNLDPMCLFAGGPALQERAKTILDHLGRDPFIFNLGHGIHKETPLENVEALVDIIRGWRA